MDKTFDARPGGSPMRLTDWFESAPPMVGWRLVQDLQGLHIEESVDGDHYVVRADVPGVDPERDVQVTVHEGVLRITATRRGPVSDKTRSEFRYGTFARTVVLPAGAREDDIHASCADGVLTVRVGVGETEHPTRKIAIEHE